MTPTKVEKEESTHAKAWEQEVENPVDDYPERPLSEARGDNLVFDPSDPEARAKNLFYKQEVSEPGNVESSRLRLTELAKKTKGPIPHGDYVEDTEHLYPGYRPPVYD